MNHLTFYFPSTRKTHSTNCYQVPSFSYSYSLNLIQRVSEKVNNQLAFIMLVFIKPVFIKQGLLIFKLQLVAIVSVEEI